MSYLAKKVSFLTDDCHDDAIKWKHFPRNWSFVWGIHWSPVNSPHKDQWRGALMFSLICVCINDWINNRDAGDLRRYRTHYDVIVMRFYEDDDMGDPTGTPLPPPGATWDEIIGDYNADRNNYEHYSHYGYFYRDVYPNGRPYYLICANQCHRHDLGLRSWKGHSEHFHIQIYSLSQISKI